MGSTSRRLFRAARSLLSRNVRARTSTVALLFGSLLAEATGLAYKLGLMSARFPDVMVVAASILASMISNPIVNMGAMLLGVAVLSLSYAVSQRKALVLAVMYAAPFILTGGAEFVIERVAGVLVSGEDMFSLYVSGVLAPIIVIILLMVVLDRYLRVVWRNANTIVKPGLARPFITSIVVLFLLDNIYSGILAGYAGIEPNMVVLITLILAIIGLIGDERKQVLYYNVLLFIFNILGSIVYFTNHNIVVSSLLLLLGLLFLFEYVVIPRLESHPTVALALLVILFSLTLLLAIPSLLILVKGYAFLESGQFVVLTMREKLYIIGGIPGLIATMITFIIGLLYVYWVLFQPIRRRRFLSKLVIVYIQQILLVILIFVLSLLDGHCSALLYSENPYYIIPVAILFFIVLFLIQDLQTILYERLANYSGDETRGISYFYRRLTRNKPSSETYLSILVAYSLILYFFYEAPVFYSYIYTYDFGAISLVDFTLYITNNVINILILIIIIFKVWYFSDKLNIRLNHKWKKHRARQNEKSLKRLAVPTLLTLIWITLTTYSPTLYTSISNKLGDNLGLPNPVSKAECLEGILVVEVKDPSLTWTHQEAVVFQKSGDNYTPVVADPGRYLFPGPGETVNAYTLTGRSLKGVINDNITLTLLTSEPVNETFIIVYLRAAPRPSPCLAIDDTVLNAENATLWDAGTPRLIVPLNPDYIPDETNTIIVAYRNGLGQPTFVTVEIHDIMPRCKNS